MAVTVADAAIQLPESGRLADDASAFEALFACHYGRVSRLLATVTRDPEEADDLAQDVFVKLLRHRFPPGREHDVAGWLYRVALNTGLNALRGRRRRQAREIAAAGPEQAPDPHEATQRAEDRSRVRAILAELDDRSVRLLVLRQVGFSYRELADVVDVAPASIGTLLARAERAFEAAYRARWPGDEEGA